MQALAELFVIDGQYEKAYSLYADVGGAINFSCIQTAVTLIRCHTFALYWSLLSILFWLLIHFPFLPLIILFGFFQLLKPEVFDFIDKHNLHDVIQEKV